MDERVPPLIEQLLAGDRRARESAADRLERIPFDPYALVPVLEHPHASRQVKAIEVLRRSRTAAAVELVLPFLASPVEIVQEKAIKTLGKIGRAAPELIVAQLEHATSSRHRLNILDVLSYLQHPQGREVLLVQADSWEASERARAIALLRRYRTAPAVETVLGALADPDVRRAAVDVAGRLRDPSFLPLLIDIWVNEKLDTLAWRDTRNAISKYGADAIDLLVERAANPGVRAKVADALAICMCFERLWELWERPEPAVRDACLQYLGHHADAEPGRARSALAEHVADPEPLRRRWCVDAYWRLARIEGPDGEHAIEMLERLAADSDNDVAIYARNTRRPR
jgi:HEAT repeat protein